MDPALLLVSLDNSSRLLSLLQPGTVLGVNVLSAAQADIGERFAQRTSGRWTGVGWEARAGAPALIERHAFISVAVRATDTRRRPHARGRCGSVRGLERRRAVGLLAARLRHLRRSLRSFGGRESLDPQVRLVDVEKVRGTWQTNDAGIREESLHERVGNLECQDR